MEQTTVLPGDLISVGSSLKVVGPGLRANSKKNETLNIQAINCGLVRHRYGDEKQENNANAAAAVWLDCDNRRYVPVLGDFVIGQVIQKLGAEGWKLEIGFSELANLSNLSFEGATKKNKPNVKLGDLVYGRVTQTKEPELVCISDDRRAKSFGVLPSSGGFLLRSWPSHVRKLLSKECPLFALLGAKVPFEITCGMNGWIWVKAKDLKKTTYVVKAIEMSRYLANEQMRDLVGRLEKEKSKAF